MNIPQFHAALYQWHNGIQRDMPWKGVKNPYLIWISEIILQQTRVAQGMPYYISFVKAFPDVQTLAVASEDSILKKWQGLGYYSRARNLHKAAKIIVEEYGGIFPKQYEEIIKLPGIGAYTAAAIASFAYDLPHPVLDGNVYRIYARLLNDETPVNSSKATKHFHAIASKFFDKEQPARFNQVIMDFGAVQCLPQSPDCLHCPLMEMCQSFIQNTQLQRPVKVPKQPKKTRFFNYAVLKDSQNNYLLHKRSGNDIWKHLYEFSLTESTEAYTKQTFLGSFPEALHVHFHSIPLRQVLSHQIIIATFCEITLPQLTPKSPDVLRVSEQELKKYAFPKTIQNFLNAKSNTLGF